ncbi:hypothetical protein WJX73_010490 [Symbiochloris irregularis]|uniref:Uncharacterized protein n=1 Tax=Symbiochloris irregularis TaxID=706552 RepID=A0AAW1P7K7_9CHLO
MATSKVTSRVEKSSVIKTLRQQVSVLGVGQLPRSYRVLARTVRQRRYLSTPDTCTLDLKLQGTTGFERTGTLSGPRSPVVDCSCHQRCKG